MPTRRNLRKPHSTNTYQEVQAYSQCQINRKLNFVEDIQLRIARQTVNEVNKGKSTFKVKLKSTSLEERIQMWKEHIKNLFGNSPKVTDKLISKNY